MQKTSKEYLLRVSSVCVWGAGGCRTERGPTPLSFPGVFQGITGKGPWEHEEAKLEAIWPISFQTAQPMEGLGEKSSSESRTACHHIHFKFSSFGLCKS